MNVLVSQSTCSYTEEDSDEDEKSKVENVNKLKAPPKSHLMEKFNSLKEKRLKLERRNEKRREKRLNSKQNNIDSNLSQAESVTHVDESFLDRKLPPVKCLEKKLDQVLAEANIEKAERISDEIFAKNTQLEVLKRKEIIEYEKELDAKKKKRLEGIKRTRLNWRFEAKQRWESKSNM